MVVKLRRGSLRRGRGDFGVFGLGVLEWEVIEFFSFCISMESPIIDTFSDEGYTQFAHRASR